MVLTERSGMLTYTAHDLVLSQGRVEKAIADVSRQREIIEEFQAGGHPAGPALELLEQFELSLQQHRQHVETIRQDLLEQGASNP